MADLLPSSDCITLSAVRCKKTEREAIYLTLSHIAVHSWWEASLCPSEGEAGSFTLSSSSSACLSLMITVSQQVLHFFSFSPFLCIPTLVSLAPSRLPPSLNKFPASKGWDASCCCLALICCNDAHSAAHFDLLAVKQNSYFRQSWWGKRTVATSFRAVYSTFIVVCRGNTFLQLFWPLPTNQASSHCFLLATSQLAIIN